MSSVPAVSVVMPVFNTARYLREAIDSILAQTFTDFEFVILDDGSTDESPKIVRDYAQRDTRVRFVPLEHCGYVNVLRRCLAEARGEFLARMDSDDISLPQRFETQIAYLRENADCVAVGSRVQLIDPFGSPIEIPPHKLSHDEIDAELLLGVGWAMVHPATMMRRQVVVDAGGYREDLKVSEDLDLFLRLAERGRVANLPEVLFKYRQHLKSVNHTKYDEQKRIKRDVVAAAYQRRGIKMPDDWAFKERKVLGDSEQYRRWGWTALKSGNIGIARKHAAAALKKSPFSFETWRLTACALRGR